jgi:hypothetical protein
MQYSLRHHGRRALSLMPRSRLSLEPGVEGRATANDLIGIVSIDIIPMKDVPAPFQPAHSYEHKP